MGDPGIVRFEDEHGGLHEFPAIYRQQWEQWMQGKKTRYAELPEGMDPGSDSVIWTQPKPGDVFDDTQYGMVEEDPEAASGAYDLPRPGTDQPDAGTPPDPVEAKGEQNWSDSVARRHRPGADGPLSPDARTVGRGTDAPLQEERYSAGESLGRGYLDQAAWGFDDEAAGLGGVYDEMTRDGIAQMPWLDSLLRNLPFGLGADIPMRVDRTVMGEGRKFERDKDGELVRFQSTGNPIREPGEREIRSQMAYKWPPDIENYDPARIEATQSLEPVTKHWRGSAPRTEGRGVDAEPQGRLLDYADAALESRENYSKHNKESFEEDPAGFMAGSAFAAIPQSALTRRLLPGATSAQEADAAVRRAGPGVGKFIERAAAGAKDAVFNRGNAASAALSSAGHMEGDTPTEMAKSAGGSFLTEMVTGAIGSVIAEILLNPARSAGRGIMNRLEDSFKNPHHAQTIVTARNAGMAPEAWEKPEGRGLFGDGTTTSEMGVRPGEKMRAAQRDLLKGTPLEPDPRTPAPMPGDAPTVEDWAPPKGHRQPPLPPGWQPPQAPSAKPPPTPEPVQLRLGIEDSGPPAGSRSGPPLRLELEVPAEGATPAGQLKLAVEDSPAPATRSRRSALVGEELGKKSADNLTMAAETQRKEVEKWINTQKKEFFNSDEGKKVITEPMLKEELTKHHPRSKAWSYIEEHLKTFGGERTNRWTMPPHDGVPGEPPPLPKAAMPEGKRGKYRGLQAIDLDEMITDTSDKMKAYKGERPHDQQRYWKDIHDELVGFRQRHYKRLEQVAQQGHERLNKREANATVLGIPREASPIQTERNSPHAQAIMQRLGQFKDNPQIQEAVTNLKGYGANPELSEQAAGALATQQLISDAQKGGIGWNARFGPLHANLGKYNPGMRPAGLANLGLNSNAAVGGASREWIQWMAHLLGIEPPGRHQGEHGDRHRIRQAKP
jgi:hypothetical protein